MSQDRGCSFCEHLPETSHRGWGGRASKCPVCRQELWTGQDGSTQRLSATAGTNPSSRRGLWLAGSGVMAGLAVGILGFFLFTSGREPNRSPTVVLETPRSAPPIATAADNVEPRIVLAQAKPLRGENRARVKLSSSSAPRKVAQSAAAPTAPVRAMFAKETPPIQKSATFAPAAYEWSFMYAEHLEAQFRAIPEVDFDPKFREKTKLDIAQTAKDILKENKDTQDAFIRKLMKDRADLAGMPFLLGKDCSLQNDDSKALAKTALAIRGVMADADKAHQTRSARDSRSVNSTSGLDPAYHFFHRTFHQNAKEWRKPEKVPALQQILLAQNKDYRGQLVQYLKEVQGAKVSELLANRAVFDLAPDVRSAALHALRDRPIGEYRAVLTKGLRYPWAPFVRNAAEAVVHLNVKDLIPDLVMMLDGPDPAAPFPVVDKNGGKPKVMVRELVRVNHHRNCLLCHAPVDESNQEDMRAITASAIPVGPAPSAQDPLPPSLSPVYYSARRGVTLVRADVTYLRQDFSLQQQVEHPGKWSDIQRFDFLVRTRELTKNELARHPQFAVLEYRDAIASALRRLTGKDAPADATIWRRVLDMAPARVQANPKATR